MLYQIYNGGEEPFEGEPEDDVDDDDDAATFFAHFSAGGVPAALETLPSASWPMVLTCWSMKFAQKLTTLLLPPSADSNASSYPAPAQEH